MFVLFLCIIVLSLSCGLVANAEEYGYYCKSDDSIVFQASDPLSGLFDAFIIPKGYYIKVVGEYKSDYYKVEYLGVSGYVKKSQLESYEKVNTPDKPYFSFKLEVEKTVDVFDMPGETVDGVKVGDSSVYYLGKLVKDDFTYYAVILGDNNYKIYFLKEDLVLNRNALSEALNPVTVPSNGNTNSSTVTGDTVSEPDSVNKTAVRIVLIIGIIVPALIIVFLVFKPSKRRSKQQRRVDADDDSERFDDY